MNKMPEPADFIGFNDNLFERMRDMHRSWLEKAAGDTSDRIGLWNQASDRKESVRSDSHLQRVDDKTSRDCCERAANICSRLAWSSRRAKGSLA